MTSSEQQQQPPMPPELERIAAEAAALKPVIEPEAGETANTAEEQVDYQQDAADLVSMVFEGVGEIYPSTQPVLKPKQTRFSAALAKVMEKRGWSLAALLGKYGAEIELGFVTATMAIPLAKAIAIDRAMAKAKEEQEKGSTNNGDPQPPRPAGDAYQRAFAE